jgi:hypothetical protein
MYKLHNIINLLDWTLALKLRIEEMIISYIHIIIKVSYTISL